jgi:hypothetical protein
MAHCGVEGEVDAAKKGWGAQCATIVVNSEGGKRSNMDGTEEETTPSCAARTLGRASHACLRNADYTSSLRHRRPWILLADEQQDVLIARRPYTLIGRAAAHFTEPQGDDAWLSMRVEARYGVDLVGGDPLDETRPCVEGHGIQRLRA